jgi:hypothetical protein
MDMQTLLPAHLAKMPYSTSASDATHEADYFRQMPFSLTDVALWRGMIRLSSLLTLPSIRVTIVSRRAALLDH